jgi:hypothetical protein
VRWVGAVGGDVLNSTYERLDGWKRTVGHVIRMTDREAARQAHRHAGETETSTEGCVVGSPGAVISMIGANLQRSSSS